MDGPGDRARRVIAYGLDLDGMCRDAMEGCQGLIRSKGFWFAVVSMPRWEKVELLLGLFERKHWKVEVPDGGPVETALWYVAREMNCFHKNVLEREDEREDAPDS